jgi:hypothetical protein
MARSWRAGPSILAIIIDVKDQQKQGLSKKLNINKNNACAEKSYGL